MDCSKDINVAHDLAPHDISIVNFIMEEFPRSVNCSGNAHITPGVEDVTSMCINYTKDRLWIVQSSWLDSRKVREMTIVGSKRRSLTMTLSSKEKIKIYDARGCRRITILSLSSTIHIITATATSLMKQDEPLRIECQHFLDCIREGKTPLTGGRQLEVVRVLEGASTSLKQNGAMVSLTQQQAKPATTWSNRDVPVQRFDIDLGTVSKPATVGRAPATTH